ncbi:MAG TPA: DNA/RNA nuclease SfsA [Firmicutes bacterium]|nr:DNA/RNA nuclease SfsA [Candidatus Fermentithermobacillaceae bacterium]
MKEERMVTEEALRIRLSCLREGLVVRRLNRFVAVVMLDGREVLCHVADSGRLKELIFPGNRVMVRPVAGRIVCGGGGDEREKVRGGQEARSRPARKTSFDLVLAAAPASSACKEDGEEVKEEDRSAGPEECPTTWVSVDTRYPTRLFGQALRARAVPELSEYEFVRAEYSLDVHGRDDDETGASGRKEFEKGSGRSESSAHLDVSDLHLGKKAGKRKEPKSRFDFYLEGPGIPPALVEVKSVTLCVGGRGLFPDAPTVRGARHVRELARAVSAGYRAYAVFIAQREDISAVAPNWDTDPGFSGALADAARAGVRLLAYRCKVTPEEIVLEPRLLPVML